MKQIKPIGKQVLIQLIKESESRGGIVIPQTADRNIIVVEDIGEEVTKVKIGDEVLCFIQGAIKIDYPDTKPNLCIIKEELIFGIFKPVINPASAN